MTYVFGDAAFTGDTVFMPDFGTARCDFPGGSADTLYESVSEKIYALPDDVKVYVGHSSKSLGRRMCCFLLSSLARGMPLEVTGAQLLVCSRVISIGRQLVGVCLVLWRCVLSLPFLLLFFRRD